MVFSQKLVKRYKELKKEVPDCLLLMQVGAFMQVMDEDARAVSEVTGLKLQMAGDVDAPVVKDMLWQSSLPVAWIEETGRRVTAIAERTLVCRWPEWRSSCDRINPVTI